MKMNKIKIDTEIIKLDAFLNGHLLLAQVQKLRFMCKIEW